MSNSLALPLFVLAWFGWFLVDDPGWPAAFQELGVLMLKAELHQDEDSSIQRWHLVAFSKGTDAIFCFVVEVQVDE